MVQECVKALNAVGLEIGACDLRTQSTKSKKEGKRMNSKFVVIEINSAPSMGDITLEKYKQKLAELALSKVNEG